jgi:hypothetical protein
MTHEKHEHPTSNGLFTIDDVNDAILEEYSDFFASLGTGYSIEDRYFHIGEEHLLSESELAWLNQRLIERHCLPVERY